VEEDVWTMSFVRASNQKGFKARILLVSAEGAHTHILLKVDFEITNNVAVHADCIIELQAAVEIGVKNVHVYRDSNLMINQIL